MMTMKEFNVLVWDINSDKLVKYNVLPYFRNCYTECRKSERPTTREQWEEFVHRNGMYMYWSRCEYEIIVSSWPPRKKDNSVKIDVWYQIENNIDLIVDILMSEYNGKKNNSTRSMA